MIYFLIAGLILLVDQASKWIVVNNMMLGQSITLIEGFFYFTSHRNAGAAFGILQNQRWFFIVVTIIVVLGICYYLVRFREERRLFSVGLSFILGGAIGNLVDRVRFGEVVDFFDVIINLGFYAYDFPIFNVADSFLVIGVGVIALDTILQGVKEAKEKKELQRG